MQKKRFSLFSVILVMTFLVGYEVVSNGGGAPAGYTGSPFDNKTCGTNGGCHGGGATAMAGWITSNIPAAGYLGDSTYQITATVTDTGITKFGFELSPQDANGNLLGTLFANAETQLKGTGNEYITHVSTSTAGTDTRSWTFDWKAPAAGTGSVTFYASFNATNSNGMTSGDVIYTSTLTVQEEVVCNISLTTNVNNESDTGNCDGSAGANPSGGSIPYEYLWTGGSTSQTATGLCAGTYGVTVTDDNGCTVVDTVTIGTDTTGCNLTLTTSFTNETLTGSCDGTASATPSGGTTPYTYLWTGGMTDQTVTGLCAGTYQVTVTDSKGCTATDIGTVDTDSVVCDLTVSISATNETSSGSCDGSATASSSGGSGSYAYLWMGGSSLQTATGLCAGTYTVTVTDTEGCKEIESVTVESDSSNAIAGLHGQQQNDLQVFPNPASSYINIQINEDKQEGVLEIIDLKGSTYFQKKVPFNRHYKVDISDFPKGIYLVVVHINNETKEKLFVKH